MNVVDLIVNTIENSRNGVMFKSVAYNIFAENYQNNINHVVNEITNTLSNSYPDGQYPKRTIENLAEYWLLRIALNILDGGGLNNCSPDIVYAYHDMVRRYEELNVNSVNRNTFATNQQQINPVPTTRSLFRDGSQPSQPMQNRYDHNTNSDSFGSTDDMVAFLSQKMDDEKQDETSEFTNQNNVEEDIPKRNAFVKPVKLSEKPSKNQFAKIDFSKLNFGLDADAPLEQTDENEKIDSGNPSDWEVVEDTDNQQGQEKVTVINKEVKCKTYKWELTEFKSMTEDEAVDYRKHELNEAELRQYENIANYSNSVIPIIQEQEESEEPESVIKTGDMHLLNKLIYLPQSSDMGGSDEYFNKIHADGKAVISLLAEYGHNSGIFIGDEATRRTILDFNSKIFTINNLDVLVNQIKTSRGGLIMRNLLNCKLSEWVHDMICMPLKQQTIPLILEGHFKDDLGEYLNHVGLGEEKDDVYNLLMNFNTTLGAYMPTFKTLNSVFLKGNHLPMMSVLPVEEYEKTLVAINYTAMVRIPVDFKCLGLDASKAEEKHFIGKIDNYKQFFTLEEDILKIIKSIEPNVKNIRLIIADSSGHVVNFKRVEEAIAIMKIEHR